MDGTGRKAADAGQQQAAQMVYLAQLNAAKSNCKCEACQLLRKGVDAMTQVALGSGVPGAGQLEQALKSVVAEPMVDGEEVVV